METSLIKKILLAVLALALVGGAAGFFLLGEKDEAASPERNALATTTGTLAEQDAQGKYIYFVNPDSSSDEERVYNSTTLKDWSVCGDGISGLKDGKGVARLFMAKSKCGGYDLSNSPTQFNLTPPVTDNVAKKGGEKDSEGFTSPPPGFVEMPDLVDGTVAEAAKFARDNKLQLMTLVGVNLLDSKNLSTYGKHVVTHASVGADIWLEKGSSIYIDIQDRGSASA